MIDLDLTREQAINGLIIFTVSMLRDRSDTLFKKIGLDESKITEFYESLNAEQDLEGVETIKRLIAYATIMCAPQVFFDSQLEYVDWFQHLEKEFKKIDFAKSETN